MMSVTQAQESSIAAKKTKKLLAPPVVTPQNIPEFSIPPSYKQLSSKGPRDRIPIQKMRKIDVITHSVIEPDDIFKRISMTNIFRNHISKSVWDMVKNSEWSCVPSTNITECPDIKQQDSIQNEIVTPSWSSILQKPAPVKDSPTPPCQAASAWRTSANDGTNVRTFPNETGGGQFKEKGDNYTPSCDPFYATRGHLPRSDEFSQDVEPAEKADEEVVGMMLSVKLARPNDDVQPMAKTYAMCLMADVVVANQNASSRTAVVENILPIAKAWPNLSFCEGLGGDTKNNKE